MKNIIAIPAFKDNYIWAIHSLQQTQLVIVDPGDADPVFRYLQANKLSLHAILITHHHHDHSGGIAALKTAFPNIAVYGPRQEPIIGVTHPVQEGDIVSLNDFDLSLRILDIPGHTKGHIAYYNDQLLFSGDTLFSCGCGRIFEGTPSQMLQSLEKLKQLPSSLLMYCGHEYTKANIEFAKMVEPNNPFLEQRLSEVLKCEANHQPTLPITLESEKKTNPFLRVNISEIIQAVQKHWGIEQSDPLSIFSHLREWKNQFQN